LCRNNEKETKRESKNTYYIDSAKLILETRH